MGMEGTFIVKDLEDINKLFTLLEKSHCLAVENFKLLIKNEDQALERIKFDLLGCHPLNESIQMNLVEQVNLQATYKVALHALRYLVSNFPEKTWEVAPGPYSKGSDVRSTDGEVEGEVFAAVNRDNNKKIAKDMARVLATSAKYKFVFFTERDSSDFKEVDLKVLKQIIIPR